MTQISALGEFGLIKRLTQDIELKNPETKKGVGDDCAVLEYDGEKEVLVTTDLLMEGVHFDLTYMPMKHLGYKSAIVNFSDVYAMGGTPKQITVSLALGKRFSVEDMDDFYARPIWATRQMLSSTSFDATSIKSASSSITITTCGSVFSPL